MPSQKREVFFCTLKGNLFTKPSCGSASAARYFLSLTARASCRSVAKVSLDAVTSRCWGSFASTQYGTSTLSTTRQVVVTKATTLSSERFVSDLVTLVALTGRSSTCRVAAFSFWATPESRVVVLTSSGVFSALPGAQNWPSAAAIRRNAPTARATQPATLRTTNPLPGNDRVAEG